MTHEELTKTREYKRTEHLLQLRELESKELGYKIEDLIIEYQKKWDVTTIIRYPNFYLDETKKGCRIEILINTECESK